MKKKRIIVLIGSLLLILGVVGVVYFFTRDFSAGESSTPPKTESELLEEKGVVLVNAENFVTNANSLLQKGYSADEVNQIYEYMSEANIESILASDYVDLSEFYMISNFEFAKIERYQAYQELKQIEMKDAVTQVNLNLDEPFYQTIETIEAPSSVTVLVNKSHALPSDYVPDDLVSIPSYPNLLIKEEAATPFENLLAAAKLDNITLIPYSTYRSYAKQKSIYNRYLNQDPKEVVDTYSARPGHSEHQTGLALDIRSTTLSDRLTDSDYAWVLDNSYKYGFIVRYPKDNSTITGYQEEPWHLRYIGVEHATKVHELGITYDEYYDLYLTNR